MALRLDGYVRGSRIGGTQGEGYISPDDQREAIEAYAKELDGQPEVERRSVRTRLVPRTRAFDCWPFDAWPRLRDAVQGTRRETWPIRAVALILAERSTTRGLRGRRSGSFRFGRS
jgi:hypothetical protein